jgi:hypothetical protein
MTLTAGFGGVSDHACAALANARKVVDICEQERITRVVPPTAAASPDRIGDKR